MSENTQNQNVKLERKPIKDSITLTSVSRAGRKPRQFGAVAVPVVPKVPTAEQVAKVIAESKANAPAPAKTETKETPVKPK
jgi:hypothetical protein